MTEHFDFNHIHTTPEGRHFRHGDGVEVDGEGRPVQEATTSDLYLYGEAKYLRKATEEERQRSEEAAEHDGGAGAIETEHEGHKVFAYVIDWHPRHARPRAATRRNDHAQDTLPPAR